MAWYSRLFQNFPQFAVIHTVTGSGTVHKAEVDVFLELSCQVSITHLFKQLLSVVDESVQKQIL